MKNYKNSYDSYLICTSPRSGSTLLCRLLSATGSSGNADSHFHSPSINDWMNDYDLSGEQFASEHDLLIAIFQAAINRGTGDTGIFGLRLQRHSFDYFIQKLRVISSCHLMGTDVDCIQNIFGRTLFIYLTRPNKLDQAISLVKAEQTGLWHKAPDGTDIERVPAEQELSYDANAIAQRMADLADMEADWLAWFAEQGVNPLQISYNELSADPKGTLTNILKQLDVDPHLVRGIDVPVAKLADDVNKLWAARFEAEQHAQINRFIE